MKITLSTRVQNAIDEGKRRGTICHREQTILEDIVTVNETLQAMNFHTAEIYHRNGDGFQIVTVAGNGHKIGDITN